MSALWLPRWALKVFESFGSRLLVGTMSEIKSCDITCPIFHDRKIQYPGWFYLLEIPADTRLSYNRATKKLAFLSSL